MDLTEFLQTIKTEPNGEQETLGGEDPISLAERAGIRFEAETPENLGKPIFWHRGVPLAWEKDTPKTKVYAWCLVNLFPGRPLALDAESVGRLLGLSSREVLEALARLTKDRDLIRPWERGRELFRLNIQYMEGGNFLGREKAGSKSWPMRGLL